LNIGPLTLGHGQTVEIFTVPTVVHYRIKAHIQVTHMYSMVVALYSVVLSAEEERNVC